MEFKEYINAGNSKRVFGDLSQRAFTSLIVIATYYFSWSQIVKLFSLFSVDDSALVLNAATLRSALELLITITLFTTLLGLLFGLLRNRGRVSAEVLMQGSAINPFNKQPTPFFFKTVTAVSAISLGIIFSLGFTYFNISSVLSLFAYSSDQTAYTLALIFRRILGILAGSLVCLVFLALLCNYGRIMLEEGDASENE